jgi:nucleoside-diphosphate-sugar epimerase
MQTILGAGGAIGKELAKELKGYTDKVRLVSRSPQKVNEEDELVTADLTNAAQTAAAIKGSYTVYLTAGLPYRLKVWQQQWPVIMQNVINACKQYNTKLVFFDNIYMYDSTDLSNMTEETPVNPPSKKGKVRAQIAQMLMDEVHNGRLKAMITRSADFYGPGINSSMLQETVYKNFLKGKKATWMADASKIHSFTYTPDAAKAMAMLGNDPDAYNEVWHLPTSSEKLNGRQWVELFATEMNTAPKLTIAPALLVKAMGFFNPLMKEIHEMLYQFDRDYYFNSSKFNEQFPEFETTDYRDGVRNVVQYSTK